MSQRPASPAFRMADRLLDGKLVERLTELRGAGLSFAEVSRIFYGESGAEVSAETLRSWARVLGIEPVVAPTGAVG